jgi:sigma-B regulation protein RsbU (phosphoserine phosphatase)
MVLLNPEELVESVLRTSKLESLLPIARDLEGAIEILLGGSGRSPRASSSPAAAQAAPGQRQPVPVPSASAMRQGQVKLAIENKLPELKALNAKLTEFLEAHGVIGRAAYAVNLAIDELVSNVMRYAYVDDDTHLIDVELVIDGRQVILRIVDDGRPFDPRTGPALDLHAEDREVGGLGLILVLDMVDALCYRRVEDKNCVEVRVHWNTDVAGDEPTSGE